MDDSDAPLPKQVGGPNKITLQRVIVPGDEVTGGLVTIRVPGSAYSYLPCFTSVEKLRKFEEKIPLKYTTLKEVNETNWEMFFEDIEAAGIVKIMLDPYFVTEGKVRWTEIKELVDENLS